MDEPSWRVWGADCPWPDSEKCRHLREAWQRCSDWLRQAAARLQEDQSRLDGLWCVLASGSLGRMEATTASDADLLIVADPDCRLSAEQSRQLYESVWDCVGPLGLVRPSATGIYATAIQPSDLADVTHRGAVSPPVREYGQRLQIILDAQPLWSSHSPTPLWNRLWQWYADGALPEEPTWAYFLDELQRYYRSLRLRARTRPRAEIRRRFRKIDYSRFITWMSIVSLLGESTEWGSELDLAFELRRPPLLRLLRLYERHGWNFEPILQEYERFLAAPEGTDPLQASRLQAEWVALLNRRSQAWHPLFQQRLHF